MTMTNNKDYQEIKKFVLEKARAYKEKGDKIKWSKIEYAVNQTWQDANLSREAIRNIYRRNDDEPYKAIKNKYARTSTHKKAGRTTLRKILSVKLKRKTSIEYLVDVLPVDRETIYAEITRMELDGYDINKWTEDGKRYFQFNKRRYNDSKQANITVNDKVSLLVISDTHFGHKKSEIAFTQFVIQHAYEQGIRDVLHVGDLLEGHYMSIRPQSIKELDAIGFDEQLDLADESLPKLDGLTYYIISGNHDHTYERHAFANPVKALSKRRDDVRYLGYNFGKFIINKNIDIALVHPTDGIGQSYGLKLHQYFQRAGADKQARIVLMGHYHKHTHLHYNGQDGFIVPALVSQSQFMKDGNLASVVGAFMLHLKLNSKGELVTLTPEYIWKH